MCGQSFKITDSWELKTKRKSFEFQKIEISENIYKESVKNNSFKYCKPCYINRHYKCQDCGNYRRSIRSINGQKVCSDCIMGDAFGQKFKYDKGKIIELDEIIINKKK